MILTGLSGNEMYCLAQKGWSPSNIVVGNSVHSLGIVRGFTSGLKMLAGGEIKSITELISDGRHAAIARLTDEAVAEGAQGLTGVTSELKTIGGLIEFLAIGSAVKSKDHDRPFFSTSNSGQEPYCQLDSGYHPRKFIMGNVAYAIGLGRGLFGALRTLGRGKVKEYSDMYNHTRHLALQRIESEATELGCNAIVNVTTRILPFGAGTREMLMVGTASTHGGIPKTDRPVTSELTGDELWNLTRMGYQPYRLLLGTSVYSLGMAGGLSTFFQSFGRGEIDTVTRLVYEARENCLDHIRREADSIGADGVIGIKLFVYEITIGLVEIMAIGTAIKRNESLTTETDYLLPQAIIRDRDTFFDEAAPQLPGARSRDLSRTTP